MSVFAQTTEVLETLMGIPIVGDASLLKNLDAIGIAGWEGGLELIYMGNLENYIEYKKTKYPLSGAKEIFEPMDKGSFGLYGLRKIPGSFLTIVSAFSYYTGDEKAKNPLERGIHILVKKAEQASSRN